MTNKKPIKTSKPEINNRHGNAAKPLSLRPLKFEDAVAALLKVKPEPKMDKS
jgi:hypothetical protein